MLLFHTIFDSGYTSCFLDSSIFSTPFYLIPLEVTPVGFTQMSLISETRVDLCSIVWRFFVMMFVRFDILGLVTNRLTDGQTRDHRCAAHRVIHRVTVA